MTRRREPGTQPGAPIQDPHAILLARLAADAAAGGRAGFAQEGDAIAFARTAHEVDAATLPGELRSVHDVAACGLAVGLAHCCLAGGLGAQVDFRGARGERLLELLFGEGEGGVLLSGSRPALAALAREVPTTLFGVVGGGDLSLATDEGALHWSLDELRAARRSVE